MHEINIKVAKNGWLLTLSDEGGGKEFELFEHDVYNEIDTSPDRQDHKLPAMRDMLVSIGRYLLELDPDSKETVTVAVTERELAEEDEIIELSSEDEILPE